MPGTWQPQEVIDPIVEEIKKDSTLWELALERERESIKIQELAARLHKRPDLEPEAFPELTRPTLVEAILEFLEKRYGKKEHLLAVQVASNLRQHAYREISQRQ